MDQIVTLPFSAQVGLGAGYLCYLIAFGPERRGHGATEKAFLSFAFGIPALVPMVVTPEFPLRSAAFGALAAFSLALIWRGALAPRWLAFKSWVGLGLEDGIPNAWDAIVHNPALICGQVSVHTTDGRILYLNDRTELLSAPYEGLYLGSDGSILMAVQEEEFPDGRTETRTGVLSDHWGTRMTYIPASQIVRTNIRF